MSTQTKPSIVFCHGILADGSCFNKVMPAAPGGGLRGDLRAVRPRLQRRPTSPRPAHLEQVSSPAILVGHSYGGAVITAAGIDDRVAGLVYIAALAPDETETSQGEQDKFPKTAALQQDRGRRRARLDAPVRHPVFCGDLPEEEQRSSGRPPTPPSAELFASNAPGVAWRTKPSWYIVANNDHGRPPRAGACRGQADGRHHLRHRQQPRPDAVPPRLRPRRHQGRRPCRSRNHGRLSTRRGPELFGRPA